MSYRGIVDNDGRIVSAIFMVIMLMMVGLGVWLPFLGHQATQERDQFDIDCHARGGSVVETKNTGYECWTGRIDLNEPSVY